MGITKRQLDNAARWYLGAGMAIVTVIQMMTKVEQLFTGKGVSEGATDREHLKKILEEVNNVQAILQEVREGLKKKITLVTRDER